MKAITLWQPWASLLACGAKKYETRSWATSYRGPIAIHAAARKCDIHGLSGAAHIAIMREITHLTRGKAKTTMYLPLEVIPRGAIIATAELVGCYEIVDDTMCNSRILFPPTGATDDEPLGHDEISEHDDEFLFGDWTPGRYAWEFANMTMLPEPIPARGGQRIWNWEEA